MELALEAYDLGIELAAEDLGRVAVEIRINGALHLLDSVVRELEHAYNRAFASPREKAQLLAIQRMLAEAIPAERRFDQAKPAAGRPRAELESGRTQ